MNTRSLSPDRLKAAREAAGLNASQAARSVGVSLGTIRNSEAGIYAPRADALVRMADVYGVRLDDLFVHVPEADTPTTGRGETHADRTADVEVSPVGAHAGV